MKKNSEFTAGLRRRFVDLFAPRAAASQSRRRRPAAGGWKGMECLEVRTLMTASPMITEFMAQNSAGLLDEDMQRPDWIELYNPSGSESIDLAGWHLTDDNAVLDKWTLPSVTLPPGAYLVVFASGKDRAIAGSELHTNFSMEKDGEYLALVRPDGLTVEQEFISGGGVFPQQVADISFGLQNPGNLEVYFLNPTPGAANAGPTVTDPNPRIVINEIMYHPSSENTAEEYIELFNAGVVSVDMQGWRFSKGVDFTFGAVTMNPGEYLVVASNPAVFMAKYPAVNPARVVGGWNGTQLSNSSEEIELENNLGDNVDSVTYGDDGDWARRREIVDIYGMAGWEWLADHDGLGKSLELRNPSLSNNSGQNWATSITSQGTPGAANSTMTGDIAPMILSAAHSPLIPTSGDLVTITAKIVDEADLGVTVTLSHRVDNTGASFATVPMFDDGTNGDLVAGDGVYTAVIGPNANLAIVEFYISASDVGSQIRHWPAATNDAGTDHRANALYQVDNSFGGYLFPNEPIYRIIMTEVERARLQFIGRLDSDEANSDAKMNTTFIMTDGVETQLRYQASNRNRGHGSRSDPPNNYRINTLSDQPFTGGLKGVTSMNINAKVTHGQVLGSTIHQIAGNFAPIARRVQVRVNGTDLAEATGRMFGSYAHLDPEGGEFIAKQFPDDPDGNMYRGVRKNGNEGNQADFTWLGTSPEPYREFYRKATNESEDQWADLIELINRLNFAPQATFFDDLSEIVDIDQWVNYLAVDTLLGNRESGLNTGQGDDYSIYRGVNDPRFVFLPHDMDAIMRADSPGNDPLVGIFQVEQVNGLFRFINHPDIVPLYYGALLKHLDTTFTKESIDGILEEVLLDWVTPLKYGQIVSFADDRRAHVRGLIPVELTVTSSLPMQSGYHRTTDASTVNLSGKGHAAETRSIKVKGLDAAWNARTATWTMPTVPLNPGINRVMVQAFDKDGVEIEREFIDIWRDTGAMTTITGTITTNTTLTAAGGPYRFTSSLQVNPGVTLTIEPGASLYFDENVRLTVKGKLIAAGTPENRIRFTGVPGAAFVPNRPLGLLGFPDAEPRWSGLLVQDSVSNQNIVSYADIEFAQDVNGSLAAFNSELMVDNVSFAKTYLRMIFGIAASITIQNSYFPDMFTGSENPEELGLDNIAEPVKLRSGTLPGGHQIVRYNVFGSNRGHNDVVDIDSGRRPGPILEVYGNLFTGAGDEALDMGGDAYIHDNVFMNVHKDLASIDKGYANGISTGDAGAGTTIYVAGNIFYKVDHAINLKRDTSTIFQNNLVAKTNPNFFDRRNDLNITGAINFYVPEPDAEAGEGAIVLGNIFDQAKQVFSHPDEPVGEMASLTVKYNLMDPQTALAPIGSRVETALTLGEGNVVGDPRLEAIYKQLDAMTIQVARNKPWFVQRIMEQFSVARGSMAPGLGEGGEEIGPLSKDFTTIARLDSPAPTQADFLIGGTGVVAYKYQLDGGPWSAEIPLLDPLVAQMLWQPIVQLTGLADGPHTLRVIGKDYAGNWQAEPVANVENFTIQAVRKSLRISEVLASNVAGPMIGGLHPDLIELHNDGTVPINLADYALSDEADTPNKHFFPAGMILNPGQRLVIPAGALELPGAADFSLNADGDQVHLSSRADLDGDGLLGLGDLIALFAARAAADPSPLYDITGDGQLDQADADHMVLDLMGTRYGDANYDLSVSIGDLTLLAESFGGPGGWGQGDFNGDGQVSIGDLTLLAENFGLTGPGTGLPGNVALQDTISFGLQIPDHSIGLNDAGQWELNIPTFGAPNLRQVTGDPARLRISEWFTSGDVVLNEDFLELHNTDVLPVALGGLYLSDNPASQKTLHQIPPLSFIAADGWQDFLADGQTGNGADHLSFKLNTDAQSLALFDQNLTRLDIVHYQPQTADYSEGRRFDDDWQHDLYDLPTPGAPNMDNPAFSQAMVDLFRGLRITEIHYNPMGLDNTEFLELRNIGATTLNLNGVRLRGGVDFTFGDIDLEPGRFIVVVKDIAAFEAHYGTTPKIAGQFTGSLDNSGEELILRMPNPSDVNILRFDYEDDWYPLTDDGGHSLVLVSDQVSRGGFDGKAAWRASLDLGGSPGALDVADATPPTQPMITAALIMRAQASIDVAWTAAADPESTVLYYRIYRDGLPIGESSTLSFTDAGLLEEVPYSYTVSAVNGKLIEGAPSDPVVAIIQPDATPPSLPIISSVLAGETGLTLNWLPSVDPQTGVDHYEVYRNGLLIGVTAGLTFASTAQANAASTLFQIKAVNGDNVASDFSAPYKVSNFQNGVGFGGALDTWITEANPTQNNAASTSLLLDGQLTEQSVLIRWDLSPIPVGSIVHGVSFTVVVTNTSPEPYEIYAMLRNWMISQATWNQPVNGETWGLSGAQGAIDRATTPLGAVVASAADRFTFDLNAAGIALVQQWINTPASNFGFIIADALNANGLVFKSSETAILEDRPKLTIAYSEPPAPLTGEGDGQALVGLDALGGAGLMAQDDGAPMNWDHILQAMEDDDEEDEDGQPIDLLADLAG